jgi:hypothetical protein
MKFTLEDSITLEDVDERKDGTNAQYVKMTVTESTEEGMINSEVFINPLALIKALSIFLPEE